MPLTRVSVFMLVAGVCFVAALGCALSLFHSNAEAWQDGGLLSLVIALIP